MNIQVFISTINNNIYNIDQNTKKYPTLTIINQILSDSEINITKKTIEGVNWVEFNKEGLSRSRNLAISLAEADAVYLTDDDVVLNDDFYQIVSESLENNPTYDILAFNIQGIEKEFKPEVTKEKDINYLTSMKLSSVQLIYRYNFLEKNNMEFDELFGAGSKYLMGEENIFLFDALKKGAKIKFIPKTIAKLHLGESTWYEGMNKKYFFDRGASYWRMFGVFAPIYSITFCIRKRSEYKENMSMVAAYKEMINGMKDYVNNNN